MCVRYLDMIDWVYILHAIQHHPLAYACLNNNIVAIADAKCLFFLCVILSPRLT